jgi:hypothetical protein
MRCGVCRPAPDRLPAPPAVTVTFLWLFLAGGASLVALVWLGAAGGGDHADAAGHPGAGPTGHDAAAPGLLGEAAALLSVRGVLAACTLAGATGLLLAGVLRLPAAAAIAGALAGGVAGALAWRRVTRLLVAFDRNHAVPPDVLVGREGTLTVGIGGPGAPGIVQVVLGGVSQDYAAVAADGRPYPEGARVLVVRLLPDQALAVEASPYPALSSSP